MQTSDVHFPSGLSGDAAAALVRLQGNGWARRRRTSADRRAFIGGYGRAETGSWPLAGFRRDEFSVPTMAIGGPSYRWQLFSQPLSFAHRGFLLLDYNMAAIGKSAGISTWGGTIHGGADEFPTVHS